MTDQMYALLDAAHGMTVDGLAAELDKAARPPADSRAVAAYLLMMAEQG